MERHINAGPSRIDDDFIRQRRMLLQVAKHVRHRQLPVAERNDRFDKFDVPAFHDFRHKRDDELDVAPKDRNFTRDVNAVGEPNVIAKRMVFRFSAK